MSFLQLVLEDSILRFLCLFEMPTPQDIQEAYAGQIVAVFGVDCASGDFFSGIFSGEICLPWL